MVRIQQVMPGTIADELALEQEYAKRAKVTIEGAAAKKNAPARPDLRVR